jgi:DNA-binding SARP family transcriptional activator
MIGDATSLLRRQRASETEARLSLLGAFALSFAGRSIDLPTPAQRLLAYLAIEDRPLQRGYLAAALWLDSTDARAAGSLRSALWRIRRSGCKLVEKSNHQLQLSSTVAVDLHEAYAWVARVQDRTRPLSRADVAAAALPAELLLDWYDDWVLLERERFRQLRAHALEVLCGRLAAEGRLGEALEIGLAAVHNEPLRESAHRAVIGVHLAEGNRSEALRQYAYYRRLVRRELGVEPSPRMETLLRSG